MMEGCSCCRKVWSSVPTPCCAATASCCAMRGLAELLSISERGFTPTHPPTPAPQLGSSHSTCYSLDWSVRGVRCHRPGTLSHMTLKSEHSVAYWFACACATPNCDWRLQRSQLLSTLHWTVLPESSLPTVPELINDFFRQKLHCCDC